MSELLTALSPYATPMTFLALAVLIRVSRSNIDYIKHDKTVIKFRKDSKSR